MEGTVLAMKLPSARAALVAAIAPLAVIGILSTTATPVQAATPVTASAQTSANPNAGLPAIKPMHVTRTSGDIRAMGGTGIAGKPLTLKQIFGAYQFPNVTHARRVGVSLAYHDPQLLSNVNATLKKMGSPALKRCSSTVKSGCLMVRDARGGTNYPEYNPGWAPEGALDVATIHAGSPKSTIFVSEADQPVYFDADGSTSMCSALQTLTRLGATVSSMSWASSEFDGQSDFVAQCMSAPGVRYVAASGDDGFGASFPASAPNVVSVGGTTLTLTSTGLRSRETAWGGSGGGCSTIFAKPVNQLNDVCQGFRAQNDISTVADPATGVALSINGSTSVVGGTSLAAPIVAAAYALAGTSGIAPHAGGYDVLVGSTGSCDLAVLCTAGRGWDGPTGYGTFNKGLGTITKP